MIPAFSEKHISPRQEFLVGQIMLLSECKAPRPKVRAIQKNIGVKPQSLEVMERRSLVAELALTNTSMTMAECAKAHGIKLSTFKHDLHIQGISWPRKVRG